MNRLNVGCGATPTEGWKNYDNSPSLRYARRPIRAWLMRRLGFMSADQRQFGKQAAAAGVHWADVCRNIPERDGAVDVLYSSHMLEHLDRSGAQLFLKEAHRVLRVGGIIRIAVPDLAHHAETYRKTGDADEFVEAIRMATSQAVGWRQRLRKALVGERHHLWMYDGRSLSALLLAAGFAQPQVLPPGRTRVEDPGSLNLRERESESVYVEALRE